MISVLYTIILITNFKLIEMCIKSSPKGRGVANHVGGRLLFFTYLIEKYVQRKREINALP